MTIEDFTTYTEVDPDGELTVSGDGTRITAANVQRDVDAYIYRDLGAAHFGLNWIHRGEAFIDSDSEDGGIQGLWALSNVVDDWKFWFDNNSEAIAVRVREESGAGQLDLFDYESGNNDSVSGLSLDTLYYLDVERSGVTGATLTLRVYSDAARQTLVDSAAITTTASRTYRYVFGFVSRNTGSASKGFTGYFQHLNLHESIDFPFQRYYGGGPAV